MADGTMSGLSGEITGIQAIHAPRQEGHLTMAASETLEDGMLAALAVAVKGPSAVPGDLAPQ